MPDAVESGDNGVKPRYPVCLRHRLQRHLTYAMRGAQSLLFLGSVLSLPTKEVSRHPRMITRGPIAGELLDHARAIFLVIKTRLAKYSPAVHFPIVRYGPRRMRRLHGEATGDVHDDNALMINGR